MVANMGLFGQCFGEWACVKDSETEWMIDWVCC